MGEETEERDRHRHCVYTVHRSIWRADDALDTRALRARARGQACGRGEPASMEGVRTRAKALQVGCAAGCWVYPFSYTAVFRYSTSWVVHTHTERQITEPWSHQAMTVDIAFGGVWIRLECVRWGHPLAFGGVAYLGMSTLGTRSSSVWWSYSPSPAAGA